MITVISGSNRPGNLTKPFAEKIHEILDKKTRQKIRFLDLEKLTGEIINSEMYDGEVQSPGIIKIQDEMIMPSEKLVFVMPEYNGSYPGIVKVFIDAISVREYKKTFSGKKAGLIGVASGRAGNLRGMDHLTGVLNHIGMIVFPNKLPISSIEDILGDNNSIDDENTLNVMEKFAEGFLKL